MQFSTFLRTVLKLDAASCLGMAALVLPTAGALAGPLGIDALSLTGAGVSLIPIGLFIAWLSTRREAPIAAAYLVIFGNIGWAAASLATALTLPGIRTLGCILVAGQGLFVLAMAALEWRGVRETLGNPLSA